MTEQPEFVANVARELHDLRDKANKLETYLDGEAIKALSEYDQALLALQHAAMSTYEHILSIRLSRHLRASN